MRVAQVIGDVTLSHRLDCFAAARFLIVQPLGEAALGGGGETVVASGTPAQRPPAAEPVVALDELSPGRCTLVAISEGREAAMPFHPRLVPIDVSCAAVLDQVEVKR